ELVAFAALFVAAAGGFALLEYLAVDAPWRGRGLGRALLDRALALVRRAAPDLPVLLEVDSADEAAADRPLRLARAAFYRRAGCRRVVGLDYLLPIPGVTPPRMRSEERRVGKDSSSVASRRQQKRTTCWLCCWSGPGWSDC